MSILEEFYNGNINPSEKYIKPNSEYRETAKLLAEDIDKFLLLLTSDEKKLYENIEKNADALNYIAEREGFIEGFRLGAQIMYEIFYYQSKNYT